MVLEYFNVAGSDRHVTFLELTHIATPKLDMDGATCYVSLSHYSHTLFLISKLFLQIVLLSVL